MNEKNKIDWEELFDQLTEDITNFEWYLIEWMSEKSEHSDTYIYLEIISRLYRINEFIKIAQDAPAELIESRNLINEEFQRLIRIFNESVNNSKRTDLIFQQSLHSILSSLEENLEEIIKDAEDNLDDGENKFETNEFNHNAYQFLLYLTRIYYLVNCDYKFLPLKVNLDSSKKHFENIEHKLKEVFCFFKPLSEKLKALTEYYLPASGEWWYKTDPARYKIFPLSIPSPYPNKNENCYDYEMLAKYAYSENISADQKNDMRKHIINCEHCLNEVINLRAAESELVEEPESKPIPLTRLLKILSDLRVIGESFVKQVEENIAKIFSLLENPLPVFVTALRSSPDDESQNVALKSYYNIEAYRKEGKIYFLDPGNITQDLNEISKLYRSIDQKYFYYKIYGIYPTGEIRLLVDDSDTFLPIIIDMPDTYNLFAIISQSKETLDKNSNLVFKVLEGEKETFIDVVCLFIQIKNLENQ